MASEGSIDINKSGIGQLTAILEGHLALMQKRNDAVEKTIASTQTADSLQEAKKKALENETAVLLSIMEDIDEMNSFLKNIILIENLFNSLYMPEKKKQEKARGQYAANLAGYETKARPQSNTSSFVELIFGGQTHVSSLQKWLGKVLQECQRQKVKIRHNSGAAVKKIERSFYKAFYTYADSDGFKDLTDVLRCSLVFDEFEDLYKCFSVIELLAESTTGGILRAKDRFHPSSMPFGYRDLLINIMCPGSRIVCEIQLHWYPFYKHKSISHAMYKRARLFERNSGNLAYAYATKFLRPKLGSFALYVLSEEEKKTLASIEGGEHKESDTAAAGADAQLKFDELLESWGLGQWADVMEEEGWDDPTYWKDLTDGDLTDMKFRKGHIRKFRGKYKEWLKQHGKAGGQVIATPVAESEHKSSPQPDAAVDYSLGKGEIRLRSWNYPRHYVRHSGFALFIHENNPQSQLYMKDSTFKVVKPSLAMDDDAFVSLESVNYPGYFVRHSGFRIFIHANDHSQLFRDDATFKVVPALNGDADFVSFESKNYPNHFARHRNYELWLDRREGSQLYKDDASFKIIQ